jgi:hypothetical protein
MRTQSLTVFCKQAVCPSAKALLSYQAQEVSASEQETEWITEHLTQCDFCAAECRLLKEHEAAEEEYSVTEIPPHLRSLAEALLGKMELAGLISLSETTYEKERLTLTDA